MKKFAFFLLAMSVGILPMAHDKVSDGQVVIDEQLFLSIRDRYDGSWPTEAYGMVGAEILRDNSVLVELNGRMAEFAFYNLSKAPEDVRYIPAVWSGNQPTSLLNYFNRVSGDIACGLSSKDLKRDPFIDFKCRIRIDSSGDTHSFLDRDANSSRATPDTYDGLFEEGQHDFHWHELAEYESEAGAYSTFVREEASDASFDLQIGGIIAKLLFQGLSQAEVEDHWGPLAVKVKIGQQLWCSNTNVPGKNDEQNYKCRISFAYDGKAYQDYERSRKSELTARLNR